MKENINISIFSNLKNSRLISYHGLIQKRLEVSWKIETKCFLHLPLTITIIIISGRHQSRKNIKGKFNKSVKLTTYLIISKPEIFILQQPSNHIDYLLLIWYTQ